MAGGYSSPFFARAYAVAGPLYDLVVAYGFLPIGGERRVRREIASWLEASPGERLLALCCGTGSMERAILDLVPSVSITGVDLGRGQLRTARTKNRGRPVAYLRADATATPLPDAAFDRVYIVLALHEMTRETRLAVLAEARRVCRPEGRVLAVEHGRPRSRFDRALRTALWFLWVPGNPEAGTIRDLERHGLANEMGEAGLEIVARRATREGWIEGLLARPR